MGRELLRVGFNTDLAPVVDTGFGTGIGARSFVGRASSSPDGKQIAYTGYDGHDSEIYTIPVSGGKPVQVTNTSTDGFDPSWGSR